MADNGNTNIVHVETIENFAGLISEEAEALEVDNHRQHTVKEDLMRHLASLQRQQIYNLRKAFE